NGRNCGVEENPNRPPEDAADEQQAGEGVKESAPAQTQAAITMPSIPPAPEPGEAAPAAQPPAKRPPAREIPAGTKPAATKAPGPAVKAGATPTSTVAKGIPKAAARPAVGSVVESTDQPVNKTRRRIVWASVAGFLVTSFLMFVRFFLPRAIFEPSTVFRIGFPSDYGLGVDTKWQQQYRIWVNKSADKLFVIYARCTHLGCTPDWKSSENKFKCPCHGSGYDIDGINFEGPAPRPMDRAHVTLDAEGQIVVDTNRLYEWPKGETNEFNEEGSYIPL
ncbi:MAG: Rieske 2Fe-2S domain-containing protein, partial [Acidobacteria bacterium]|nr:Rieske 2Fe-2S domain-containing protein [Acidobacteriota bacterium]